MSHSPVGHSLVRVIPPQGAQEPTDAAGRWERDASAKEGMRTKILRCALLRPGRALFGMRQETRVPVAFPQFIQQGWDCDVGGACVPAESPGYLHSIV